MSEQGAFGGPPPGPDRPPAPDPAADAWRVLQEGFAGKGHGADGLRCVELCPICRAADVLRAGGPPELRGQLSDFQREALLTLRALLDHYIERFDERPEAGGRVEEIPID